MDIKTRIIKMPNVDYTPDPGGLGKVFFSKMSSYKNTTAQIDGLTGQKDSYSSLLQRSVRTAITMRSKGITSEDVISICTFNHLNCVVPFIASLFLGAKLANLDPILSLSGTIHLLKQVHPKMIFVGPEAIELIEEALAESGINSQMVIFGKSDKHLEFEEFLKESDEEKDFKPIEVKDLKETVAIFFSSGTTGLPKGICLNHSSLLTKAFLYGERGLKESVILEFTPIYTAVCVLFITISVLYQRCRLLVPKFDPDLFWNLIQDYEVTSLYLPATQLVSLCKMERPKGLNLSSIYDLNTGGTNLSTAQIEEARRVFPDAKVLFGYGLTETTAFCITFKPNVEEDRVLELKNPGSCGRPLEGFWFKVVDPETEEALGPNQNGEIRIKSEMLMNGYYNLDSSNAWDGDGWLKTGDVGYYNEDHCFFIVDRIKEMLKYRVAHVVPAVIEGVLLTHPKIESAVVIGLPHPEDGDLPMAIVVLKSGVNDVREEEIERFVAERVDDRHKLRGGVKITNCIPLTATGKIKRSEVKNKFLKGLA